MQFANPLAFLLLLLIPVLVARHRLPGFRQSSFYFSSTALAKQAGISRRQQFRQLPLLLRVLALVFLVIALARPLQGTEKIYEVNKGVAIEMVVDRSGSMGAEMVLDGELLNRLEVVKRVFLEFVLGKNGELPGRPNDLIGLVTFARYADTSCPLTLSQETLAEFIRPVQLVSRRDEDGTAIGDGIALAAARLKTAEENLARSNREKQQDARYEIKSKVIILLTDGEHNAGSRTPLEAAALASEWGIKIYAIGVGGGEQVIRLPILGTQVVQRGSAVDEKTLQAVADKTGGIFRQATDSKSLREIYQEIDRLEKSDIESVRYVDFHEYFIPFAAAALGLLLLEILLNCTLFRKNP